jgi:hypothetical protein
MIELRTLKPSEIEIRVGGVYASGFTLLLYKDARADADILDDAVGAENWTATYYRDSKGVLFCRVAINPDPSAAARLPVSEWPYKEDCGTESFSEKDKGEASDAFKRAVARWGVRELYSSPFIWIPAETYKDGNGWKLKNAKDGRGFTVTNIEYDEGRKIAALTVEKDGAVVFSHLRENGLQIANKTHITPDAAQRIEALAIMHGVDVHRIYKAYKVDDLTDLTPAQYANIVKRLENGDN